MHGRPPRLTARPREPESDGVSPRSGYRSYRLALALAALGWGLALALGALGCASAGYVPDAHPGPAARAALLPEYRIFYDELKDYGDWILVEPYGFVFRPRTEFASWTPYYDGFWSPSDSYGWVWVSAEPYGWATFHYGRWFEDPYQGWVWVPGIDWAPAWVSWSGSGDYVGWAPMGPSGAPSGGGGMGDNFHFVTRGDLGSTDLKSRIVPPDKAVSLARDAEPITNTAEVDHVRVNAGPPIEWIEQVTGPLQRARVQEFAPEKVRRLGETTAKPGAGLRSSGGKDPVQLQGEAEARRARSFMQQKQSSPAPVISRIAPRRFKAEAD